MQYLSIFVILAAAAVVLGFLISLAFGLAAAAKSNETVDEARLAYMQARDEENLNCK